MANFSFICRVEFLIGLERFLYGLCWHFKQVLIQRSLHYRGKHQASLLFLFFPPLFVCLKFFPWHCDSNHLMSEWELRIWEKAGLETAHIHWDEITNGILFSDNEEMSSGKTREWASVQDAQAGAGEFGSRNAVKIPEGYINHW